MRRKFGITILSIIFIICISLIAKYYIQSKKSDSVYQSIRDKFYINSEEGDIYAIQKENSDILGFITIDNTKIDYPFVQGKDNTFYLTHNILKEKDPNGAIFLDCSIDIKANPRNIILYGHNMKNGLMFRDLNKFKNKNFFIQNNIITLKIGNETFKYKIFSIEILDGYTNYIRTGFIDDKDFADYLDFLKKHSLYDTNESVNEKDFILTLSTCSYEKENGRLVVHGKRIY